MPKQSKVSKLLKERIIEEFNANKTYRCISNTLDIPVSTVGFIVKKWKELRTTDNLPRSGAPRKISERSRRQMMRKVRNNPFVTKKELQTDLSLNGTHVCKRTISKELRRQNIKSRSPRKTPLLTKRHLKLRLEFAKTYLNKNDDFFKQILWSDESKIELFGHNDKTHVWRKDGTAYDRKNTIPTVKHGGGNIMIWGCFSFNGTGTLEIINGTMNGIKYREILDNNLQQAVEKLELGHDWWFQQDNDPKLTAKATSKWLQDRNIKVLKWPSQSPDLNPIENLWRKLKHQVHERSPSNLEDLKLYILEEWNKIPLETCQNLIKNYKSRLRAVIANKGGSTKY